jgi:hypothetical protein
MSRPRSDVRVRLHRSEPKGRPAREDSSRVRCSANAPARRSSEGQDAEVEPGDRRQGECTSLVEGHDFPSGHAKPWRWGNRVRPPPRTERLAPGCRPRTTADRWTLGWIVEPARNRPGWSGQVGSCVRAHACDSVSANWVLADPELATVLAPIAAGVCPQGGSSGDWMEGEGAPDRGCPGRPISGRPGHRDHARSNRSRFMTLSHAATKSRTNFSFASSHP